MASVLIHAADESVTLTARAVQGLLERGDGDAALLYLALLRRHGAVAPRALAGELRWDRGRIEAAEQTLRELGLVAPAAESVPEPADERPEYPREDIVRHLDGDGEFRGLVAEVERKLGKKLTTPDLGVLLGLSDYLGLPTDVIYLLVCHCAERVARRYGEGRRPTLRQIEREGYAWARRGIDTQAEAAEYLRSRFSLSTTPEELMDTLNDLVTEEYRSRVPMKPGADRLLARLADSGISCCIATASEAFQARSAMERLGLWPHFRFAVSCVQYGGKTRPDIYLEAARRLGTVPAETVVFEDALHAARTAYEAGFRVCGVWDVSAEEDQAALKALADWYVRDLGDWVP